MGYSFRSAVHVLRLSRGFDIASSHRLSTIPIQIDRSIENPLERPLRPFPILLNYRDQRETSGRVVSSRRNATGRLINRFFRLVLRLVTKRDGSSVLGGIGVAVRHTGKIFDEIRWGSVAVGGAERRARGRKRCATREE